MTLRKFSKDDLKNRKLPILFGQQSPKTKYQRQGKEKGWEGIFVFNKTIWPLEASILSEQLGLLPMLGGVSVQEYTVL